MRKYWTDKDFYIFMGVLATIGVVALCIGNYLVPFFP